MAGVRIPADVDREDRLLAGLTARQLTILAVTGVTAWGVAHGLGPWLPAPVVAAMVAPLVVAAVAVTFGQKDGLSADRLLLAAARHWRGPRHLVPAPAGLPRCSVGAPAVGPRLGRVVFPALAVEADGLVDLGRDGAALICRATTVNLALRSEAEQEALVAAFGRVLNGLAGPLQVVIHTEAVDLDDHVDRLVHAAPGLPHPGLESAAGDHARFLAGLAQQRDVWRRQIFLIVRERLPLAEAASTLHRRVEELGSLLAGAGVKLTVLDGGHVADLLLRHTRPDATPPAGLSLPDEIIRTAPG